MSAKDDANDSETHIPDDIADAFDTGESEDTRPESLEFDEDTAEVVRIGQKPVGRVLYCETYDCLAYYSLRHDEKHFYQKGKGYALNDDILFDLDEQGVEKVFIGLRLERTVLEFDLEQYLDYEDGDKFNYGFGDQRYTPKANAVHTWPNAVDTISQ